LAAFVLMFNGYLLWTVIYRPPYVLTTMKI